MRPAAVLKKCPGGAKCEPTVRRLSTRGRTHDAEHNAPGKSQNRKGRGDLLM